MPRGQKSELTATERRLQRIKERQEERADKSTEMPADERFERSAKKVSADAREIHKAVQGWMYGEMEAEDLIQVLRVHWKTLETSVQGLAAAYKMLSGK
jgi:hypothetical protein